jgi:hypothetical protein
MLPVIERGQSVDGKLAWLVGVSLVSVDGSQNSFGDYFAIHFQLADVLKRSTCWSYASFTATISAGSRDRFWSGGLTWDMMSARETAVQALGRGKKPRDKQGNLALTSRG